MITYESVMALEHRTFWQDDFNVQGMIAHNEPINQIKEMLVRFKYSEHCKEEDGLYKFNLIAFVKHFLSQGYNWKLLGKPQWEDLQPKKRKAFIKPKVEKKDNFPTPQQLVNQVWAKHQKPDTIYNILDEMARTIALVPDQLKREIHIQDLATHFNFNYEVLKRQVEIKRNQQQKQNEHSRFF